MKKSINENGSALVWVIGILALVIIAAIFWFGYIKPQEKRESINQERLLLENSLTDLQLLVSDLRLKDSLTSGSNKLDIKRTCNESSAKYGRGTVICSSDISFSLTSDQLLSSDISSLLKKHGFIFSDKGETGATSFDPALRYMNFTHENTGNSCSAYSVIENNNYNFSCRKTVTDFLPGYEVK